MREIHRAIHFDFHTMPGIHDLGRDFDAAVFAQRLADAHVDYINFFSHCNLGFAYYPTKLGIPYPTMQGDLFGDVLHECHKRNIGVTAYINIGLMHEQQRLHPEWCRMDKEGRIYRDPGGNPNFFRTICYNNPGYHDFLLGMIREICDYNIDGLFCDCMHFFPCHCDQCTKDMVREGVDLHDEKAVEDFSRRVMLRVSREIKDIVGSDRYLYLNGMPYYEFRHLDTHAEIECLPGAGWGYDFFGSHAAYARTIHDVCLYMTGRFQGSWGDFGGYKGRASLENDVYDALSNAFVPSVGDHLHPAENINEQMYREIGNIFERVKQYETYTKGARYYADIGVLTASTGYLGHEYAGLARMLGELKLGFNILNQAEDFSAYRLVILPEGLVADDALAARLKAYLDAGGRILCTGTGGLTPDKRGFALPEALTYMGEDSSNSSYFTFVNLPQGTADMPWSMYQEGILMTAQRDADVRAHYVKPYFNKHWDGMHYYYYTPPERQTEHAAAAITGGVGRICFGVFTAYFEAAMREHKLLVQQLMDELLPNPLIQVEKGIPSTARVTVTGRDDYLLVHVKATFPEPRGKVNIVEEHVMLPAGAVIHLRGEYPSVVLLPEKTPVDSRIENGYTIITLPAITGYAMLKAASNIT